MEDKFRHNYTLMESEPALALGVAFTAIAQAAFQIARATGFAATNELEQATTALIMSLLMLPAVASYAIRFFVTPAKRAEDKFYDGVIEGYRQAYDDRDRGFNALKVEPPVHEGVEINGNESYG